jgi:hypothetical protein
VWTCATRENPNRPRLPSCLVILRLVVFAFFAINLLASISTLQKVM